MATALQTNNLSYIDYNNPQQQIELSLETKVFLAYKYGIRNRRKILRTLSRAGSIITKQLTDITKFISPKAVDIANAILNKLINGEEVLLNHKYLSMITRCKSSAQNNNLVNELSNLFDTKYHRFLYKNGRIFKHHIEFTISTSILGELRNEGVSNTEFYPKNISSPYTKNMDTFNKSIRSSESNFLDNSDSSNIQPETSNLVEAEEELLAEEGGHQASIHSLKPNKAQRISKSSNQRKKTTNADTKARKAKLIRFKQYAEPKNLADHYPLTDADCSLLQSKSTRYFDLNAQNEILLRMSNKSELQEHSFPSKASFLAYLGLALKNEMRNAEEINNIDFRIKANLTQEEVEKRKVSAKKESFLAEVETRAITHRSDETQFKAKLVGTLGKENAYSILSNLISTKINGEVFEMYFSNTLKFAEESRSLIYSQVKATGYKGIERLGFIFPKEENSIEEGCRVDDTEMSNNNEKLESVELPQGVWGQVAKELVAEYGVDIYKHWFSKLTATVDENMKTIELKASSEFVRDWVAGRYESIISEMVTAIGFELKVVR